MNNTALDLASVMLEITKVKFCNNFHDIKKVKIFWHNLTLLYFAKAICKQLSSSKHNCSLNTLAKMNLIPDDLLSFEKQNMSLICDYEFFMDDPDHNINLALLRECLLGIDLCIRQDCMSLKQGKVARDTTGSYYTPCTLAKAVVSKAFRNTECLEHLQNSKYAIRIADFSCGGGEFFNAAQKYLFEEKRIPYSVSATFFWGTDVDPIVMLITVGNLLSQADYDDWHTISSHFRLGNPLVFTAAEGNLRVKHDMFALGRFYAPAMGINFNKKDFFVPFDIVLGNPPWEKIRFEERKFFSSYSPEISDLAKKDERGNAISNLQYSWPELFNWFEEIITDYAAMCSRIFKHPLIVQSVFGELNTYALFTELSYRLLSDNGICSLIVKSTLVTTPAQKTLWSYLLKNKVISSVSLFENRKKIFQIDSRERFAIIVLSNKKTETFLFCAGLQSIEELYDCPEIKLTENDVLLINPFSGMLPNTSSTENIQTLLKSHAEFPLFQEVYPKCHFGRLIHLTAHAQQIDREKENDNLPIYEGKFIEQYDARFSTFKGMDSDKKYAAKATAKKNDEIGPDGLKLIPESRYFVKKSLWDKYSEQYNKAYSLCWRSLTSATNARTMIAMILPTCPTCQSIQMLQVEDDLDLIMLLALFNSIPFDYFVRLKMPGIDLTQSVIRQIPVPDKATYEKVVVHNDICTSLKIHILSCVYAILRKEPILNPLMQKIEKTIYPIDIAVTLDQLKQMLDHLFAEAYNIDAATYHNIMQTFPKY
ncbi:Eco57I restriction-modification methylase domain-containing protein [Phascolarctobacterium sp.]